MNPQIWLARSFNHLPKGNSIFARKFRKHRKSIGDPHGIHWIHLLILNESSGFTTWIPLNLRGSIKRIKLINALKQSPSLHDIDHNFMNCTTIDSLTLMYLLSPNTTIQLDQNNPICRYHVNEHDHSPPHPPCSYIINAIGSYIANCFEKRWSFLAETRNSTI